jgi:hypothetical protein
MTVSHPSIPRFSGKKSDYPQFRRDLLDRCANTGSFCIFYQGSLGKILSPAEWLATTDFARHNLVAGPFVPVPHPGPRPAAAAAFPAFKFDSDIYFEDRKVELALKESLLEALDPVSKLAMNVGATGARTQTLATILAILDGLYGTQSASDLSQTEDSLKEPYRLGTSVEDFMCRQKVAHAELAANLQAMPERSKVRFLVAALVPCGVYSARIEMWKMAFPTVVLQTFASLEAVIIEFDGNRDASATSGTHLYATAAAALTAAPPTAQGVVLSAESVAQIATALAAIQRNDRAPVSLQAPLPDLYCHTHGVCKHDGFKCKHPAPGHVKEATAANKMGGRTEAKVYAPRA